MALPARLLLVDDEEFNRDLIGRRLRRGGYQVDLADSGPRALAMLAGAEYDLVLLDQAMPRMTGIETLREIRRTHSPSELPVIMVTALDDTETVVQALQSGANDYITKPTDFAVAMARIETRLRLDSTDRVLRRSNELYRLALRASEEGLWDWDLAAGSVYYSPRWLALLGLAEGDISSSPEEWLGRIHPDDRQCVSGRVQDHIEGRTAGFQCEYRMRHRDGQFRWMENRGAASRDSSGNAVRLAGCQTDITVRKTIDPLTSLPNRMWLEEELVSLAGGRQPAALLVCELDGFERVEGSLRSGAAGRLIAAVAWRLRDSLGSLTGLPGAVVARVGEHQFGVLLPGAPGPAAAQQLAHQLQTALALPFQVAGDPWFASASVGIAMASGGDAGADLLRDAGAALRHAREQGTGRREVFRSAMRQHDLEEVRLVNDLRHALDRHEFDVFYQPKVDLHTGQMNGFEALIRWRRPGFGLVLPGVFIPAAERTGLIVPIGQFVLERACRDTAEVRRHYPRIEVSVNVSGRQFAEPDLVEQVRACLDASGLEPSALRLEVTETFLLTDPEKALAMLRRFRSMGVGLKLDDFGAGYSSLDYLQKFPFDTLKLDRSFVARLLESHESAEIVRAIAGLSRSLHMQLVAEGIENRAQLEWLKALGCRYGQGFWFSPPVELSRLWALLEQWPTPACRESPEAPEAGACPVIPQCLVNEK